jgi:hypothetical protein
MPLTFPSPAKRGRGRGSSNVYSQQFKKWGFEKPAKKSPRRPILAFLPEKAYSPFWLTKFFKARESCKGSLTLKNLLSMLLSLRQKRKLKRAGGKIGTSSSLFFV